MAKTAKRVKVPTDVGFAGAIKVRKGHFAKGYTSDKDDELVDGQLFKKGLYALTMDERFYPPNIGDAFRGKIEKLSQRERWNEGMAFIAANILREDRAEKASQKASRKSAPKKAAKKKAAPKKAAKKKAAPKKAAKKSAPKKSAPKKSTK